jgi:hypothetical protein
MMNHGRRYSGGLLLGGCDGGGCPQPGCWPLVAHMVAVVVPVAVVAVPVSATAVLSGALKLPLQVEAANPPAVPVVVGWTWAASPVVGSHLRLKRSGPPYVTHISLDRKATGCLRHLMSHPRRFASTGCTPPNWQERPRAYFSASRPLFRF